MAGVLFEDIFDVKDIDPEGKKFDRGNVTIDTKFVFYSIKSLLVTPVVDPSALSISQPH